MHTAYLWKNPYVRQPVGRNGDIESELFIDCGCQVSKPPLPHLPVSAHDPPEGMSFHEVMEYYWTVYSSSPRLCVCHYVGGEKHPCLNVLGVNVCPLSVASAGLHSTAIIHMQYGMWDCKKKRNRVIT